MSKITRDKKANPAFENKSWTESEERNSPTGLGNKFSPIKENFREAKKEEFVRRRKETKTKGEDIKFSIMSEMEQDKGKHSEIEKGNLVGIRRGYKGIIRG